MMRRRADPVAEDSGADRTDEDADEQRTADESGLGAIQMPERLDDRQDVGDE